jgi:hypothetical protein
LARFGLRAAVRRGQTERVLAAVGTLHAALPEQTHEKLGGE